MNPALTNLKASFGSDNHSGIHPRLLNALIATNSGHTASYGTDPVTQLALQVFKDHFGENSESFFVFNGTAANVLAIQSLVESHHAVLCSDVSHLWLDECGAPEKNIGCKLIPVPSKNGKISPETLQNQLVRLGDQHHSQPKLVSITQPTELGTLYSFHEMKEISAFCKKHNLLLHIDGARFIYAPLPLQKTYKELTSGLSVSALSFGGTKNGLLFGEAVVLFQTEAQKKFKYIRKQSMQLPSKMRFVAAQFIELLQKQEDQSLWEEIATHGHRVAKKMESLIQDIPELTVTQKVEANSIFVKIPRAWVKALKQENFFYIWDESTFEARWMFSFDSQEKDLIHFVNTINNLRKTHDHEVQT